MKGYSPRYCPDPWQHSINGSPLVLPRNGVLSEDDNDDDEDDEELEEHILPDSFEDLPGDSTDSLSFTAVNKEDPQVNQETTVNYNILVFLLHYFTTLVQICLSHHRLGRAIICPNVD